MTTPQHCPGFEQLQHLQSFVCKCSHCGKEIEIFSDEFDKKHVCKGCGKEIDFTQCTLETEAQNHEEMESSSIRSVFCSCPFYCARGGDGQIPDSTFEVGRFRQ